MKNMSLIMKEAHKMAKEIKAEFKEVDYKFQLGLCISYLLKEEEKMVELQGSEKQIKWANDIREKMLKLLQEENAERILFISYAKKEDIEKAFNIIDDAVWFIDNRTFSYKVYDLSGLVMVLDKYFENKKLEKLEKELKERKELIKECKETGKNIEEFPGRLPRVIEKDVQDFERSIALEENKNWWFE